MSKPDEKVEEEAPGPIDPAPLSEEEQKIVDENPEMKWKTWPMDPGTKRPIGPNGDIMKKKTYKKNLKKWKLLCKGKKIKVVEQGVKKKKPVIQQTDVADEVVAAWKADSPELMERQPTMNVMTMGHVAHGKSTLMKALSGESTQRSSSELKANMTIKLGYASAKIYICDGCPKPKCYSYHKSTQKTSETRCEYPECNWGDKPLRLLRHYSFVDCPGHHSYMGTMLSAPSVVDGAILVVAANTTCPAPQTAEHMSAAFMLGLSDKILVAQNKVDLVKPQRAVENSYEIESFIRNYTDDRPRIVPICAQMECNIDAFCESLVKHIPVPDRSMTAPLRMICIRSFDVNKPGTQWMDLQGGVIGGTIMSGTLRAGMDVEIRPGFVVRNKGSLEAIPIRTKVYSIQNGPIPLAIAAPGGNVGVQTTIDPSLTKDNLMVGAMIGTPGTLPAVFNECVLTYQLMNKAMRNLHTDKEATGKKKQRLKMKVGEKLLLNIGSHSCQGEVSAVHVNAKFDGDREELISGDVFGPTIGVKLSYPACAACGTMIAISMKLGEAWRLVGRAILEGVVPLPIRETKHAQGAEAVSQPDMPAVEGDGGDDEKKAEPAADGDEEA